MSRTDLTRREFIKTAAGIAGLAVLGAGCGGPASPPATSAPAASTPVAKPTRKPVNLSLWHGETPPNRVKVFQQVIDKWNTANPDVQVSAETFNWTDAYAKVPAAIQAGNPPDICFTVPAHMHAVLLTGAVQPLDALFAALDKNVKYFPNMVRPFRFDGKLYALPMFNLTHILLYRTDLLDKAGFKKPPATWKEWEEVAKALTGGGKYGLTLPASKHLYTDQCVTDFMVTNKTDIFDPEGKLVFNSPATVEAFRFYGEMFKYSPPDAPNMTFAEANASFLTGQSGLTLLFGALFGRFPTEAPQIADLVAATPVPIPENGQKGCVGAPNAAMILTKDPDRIEGATRFLTFLTEGEMNAYWLSNMQPGLYLPVTEATMKAKTFWEHPIVTRYKDSINVAVEATKGAVAFGFNHDKPQPKIAGIDGANLLAQVAQKVCVDKMKPEEAVAWGHQKMKDAIA